MLNVNCGERSVKYAYTIFVINTFFGLKTLGTSINLDWDMQTISIYFTEGVI